MTERGQQEHAKHGNEPTLVVSRNTKTSSLSLKSSMRRARWMTGVEPSMRWYR